MGLLWALLMPSLVVGAGAIVRIAIAEYSDSTVSAYDIESIVVRAVAWSFFIPGIRFGTNSLLGNQNLVTKLAFPKEVFPLAATLSHRRAMLREWGKFKQHIWGVCIRR